MRPLLDAEYLRRPLGQRQATQQAVVRRDKPLLADLGIDYAALAAHARINDGDMNGTGWVPASRFGKDDGTGPNIA